MATTNMSSMRVKPDFDTKGELLATTVGGAPGEAWGTVAAVLGPVRRASPRATIGTIRVKTSVLNAFEPMKSSTS